MLYIYILCIFCILANSGEIRRNVSSRKCRRVLKTSADFWEAPPWGGDRHNLVARVVAAMKSMNDNERHEIFIYKAKKKYLVFRISYIV